LTHTWPGPPSFAGAVVVFGGAVAGAVGLVGVCACARPMPAPNARAKRVTFTINLHDVVAPTLVPRTRNAGLPTPSSLHQPLLSAIRVVPASGLMTGVGKITFGGVHTLMT
jgi:hypothetical protein